MTDLQMNTIPDAIYLPQLQPFWDKDRARLIGQLSGAHWPDSVLRRLGRIINAMPYGKCTGRFAEREQVKDMSGYEQMRKAVA